MTTLLDFFSKNESIKVQLFCYLFQVSNWFGTKYSCYCQAPKGNRCGEKTFDVPMPSLDAVEAYFKGLNIYNDVSKVIDSHLLRGEMEILEMFRRMVPNCITSLICLIFMALPLRLI